MGNWKNRRRFFYHQYRDPASSYYNHQRPSPPRPGFAEDGVPSWEKKFCSKIGSVPWQKIVNAKKFLYCHDSVINWDDSASEDAFHNAKKRFWAEINCLPRQISLPDPDMYIDEINWHPDIDPDLVKELERAFFAPEEGENDDNVEHYNKKIRNLMSVPSEGWNRNTDEARTPWEGEGEGENKMGSNIALQDKPQGWNRWPISSNDTSNVSSGDTPRGSHFLQGNEVVEGKTWGNSGDKLQGWNRSVDNQVEDWDNKNVINDDNPWDRSFPQGNGGKGNTRGDSSDKLWGWDHSGNQVYNQSKERDSGGSPWESSSQGVGPVKDKAWGSSNHTCWGKHKQEPWKLSHGCNSRESNLMQGSRNLKDRQWRGSGGKEQGWKQWDNPHRDLRELEFRQPGGGWRTRDDECHRKREGSHHYVTGNKHTRYEGNDYQASHRWNNGGATKKRASFAYE